MDNIGVGAGAAMAASAGGFALSGRRPVLRGAARAAALSAARRWHLDNRWRFDAMEAAGMFADGVRTEPARGRFPYPHRTCAEWGE